MKSQKGITLVSLTIYIIGMTIVVATASMISSNFYSTIDSVVGNINPLTEYTKFTNFFSEETNHSNIKVIECKENYIVFDNGVQYSYVEGNKGIYRDKVKVCKNVENCTFAYQIKNGKDVVTVKIKMQNGEENKVDYTLKY